MVDKTNTNFALIFHKNWITYPSICYEQPLHNNIPPSSFPKWQRKKKFFLSLKYATSSSLLSGLVNFVAIDPNPGIYFTNTK